MKPWILYPGPAPYPRSNITSFEYRPIGKNLNGYYILNGEYSGSISCGFIEAVLWAKK